MFRCRFCEATTPDVPTAIRDWWLPAFWAAGEKVFAPTCPACVRRRLVKADGKFVILSETAHPTATQQED